MRCYLKHLIRMSNLKKYKDFFANEITFFGGIPFSIVLFFLVFLLGYKEFSYYLLLSLILGTVITIMIRSVHHKDRPKKMPYINYFEKIYSSSFPSMHIIRTSIYVTLFTLYFGGIYFFTLFAIIHMGVFWSRYYLKKHYLDDLIFGTFFGIVISLLINFIA